MANSLSLQDGKTTLLNTIRDCIRHRDYDHVCDLAERYTSYVTGEDVKKLLVQFVPREDEAAFKQRVALTQLITPYIANRIMTPMYKAGRTTAAKVLNWDSNENSGESKKKLMDAVGEFYGETSLDDYLAYRMVELDSTDPNSFIVIELNDDYNAKDPNTKADPYPFEVNSREAVNYKYRNNELQFLIVKNCINDLDRYTIYLDNDAIVGQEIEEEDLDAYLQANPNAEIFYKDPDKKRADEIYIITTFPHKAGRIPAIRVGTKRDLNTRGRTCVPLMHAAKTFFEKSIKTISEYDMTITLHAFPQKITYDSVCQGDIKNQVICTDGKQPSGELCSVCKGTGFNEHKSAQDILRVKMPGDIKDVVSLENFIAYKNPPVDILTFLKELGMYDLPELAVKSVYTSELFAVDAIAQTATEKNIDLESVYDALKPFTDQWSRVYKHSVTIMAAYLSIGKGLTVDHKFPKDFKMKPMTALLDDLTKANSSGAPSYIKKEINRDIAQKLYVDKPEEVLKIEVKEKFFPFNGKIESEITTVIMNNLASTFNKVLYANFDMIFDELDQENSDASVSFYKLETSAQKELLVAKVQEYMMVIEEDQASSRASSFGGAPTDNTAGSGDTQDYNVGDSVTLNGQPVDITDANPGPDGGIYTVTLSDNTQQTVSGKDLVAA